MTPREYMVYKGLKKESLRDNMNDLELIFSMLGEKATTEITKISDSKKFNELKDDTNEGGSVAGGARKDLERRIKIKVFTKKKCLTDAGELKEIK